MRRVHWDGPAAKGGRLARHSLLDLGALEFIRSGDVAAAAAPGDVDHDREGRAMSASRRDVLRPR
jgi:hypothetical protein